MNEEIKELSEKTLKNFIEDDGWELCDFIDDNNEEMQKSDYELLKNNKAKIELLKDDYNYDFAIIIGKFSALGVLCDPN